MTRFLLGVLMVASALSGIGLAFWIVTFDAPVHFHALFVDYGDPERPGHLKGAIVSTPELLVKTLLAVALLTAATRLWRRLRKSGMSPAA